MDILTDDILPKMITVDFYLLKYKNKCHIISLLHDTGFSCWNSTWDKTYNYHSSKRSLFTFFTRLHKDKTAKHNQGIQEQ